MVARAKRRQPMKAGVPINTALSYDALKSVLFEHCANCLPYRSALPETELQRSRQLCCCRREQRG